MYGTSILSAQELPEISFEFASKNEDGITISYGPKNGFLWRGEELNTEKVSLIDGLNKVFQTGFQDIGDNVLQGLPYIQSHYGDFIGAANTYLYEGEPLGRDNEGLSAGTYGYIYLIDTDKKNKIESIPLCEENISKLAFVTDYKGDYEGNMITAGPEYAIIKQPGSQFILDPKFIIGAMPSAFVAFALGINEKSFIKNPAYKEILYYETIKEAIGEEFFLIVPERLSMKYPNLALSEVYQRYLQVEEHNNQQANLDLGAPASSLQNHAGVSFFSSSSSVDKPTFFSTTHNPPCP